MWSDIEETHELLGTRSGSCSGTLHLFTGYEMLMIRFGNRPISVSLCPLLRDTESERYSQTQEIGESS